MQQIIILFTKVDVVMQNTEAPNPLDFLARFAGPLAWLVAGLLLLFGGVGGAGPAGPGWGLGVGLRRYNKQLTSI